MFELQMIDVIVLVKKYAIKINYHCYLANPCATKFKIIAAYLYIVTLYSDSSDVNLVNNGLTTCLRIKCTTYWLVLPDRWYLPHHTVSSVQNVLRQSQIAVGPDIKEIILQFCVSGEDRLVAYFFLRPFNGGCPNIG